MSLAECIAEASQPPQKECKYARTIAVLRETNEHADEFDAMVMDGRMLPSVASAGLDDEGHFVSETVVRKHANGSCCCSR